MKVSELSGEQLDYWAARARGIGAFRLHGDGALSYIAAPNLPPRRWSPSRYWSQGGPILEEARIDLNWDTEGNRQWSASIDPDILAQGGTVLEAAMRAYVMVSLGDEVPDQEV